MKKPTKLKIKICSPFNENDTVEASVQIITDVNYNQYSLHRKGDKTKGYFMIYSSNYMDIALEVLYQSGFTKKDLDDCFDGDPRYEKLRKTIVEGVQIERNNRISELVEQFLNDQFDYKAKRFKELEG